MLATTYPVCSYKLFLFTRSFPCSVTTKPHLRRQRAIIDPGILCLAEDSPGLIVFLCFNWSPQQRPTIKEELLSALLCLTKLSTESCFWFHNPPFRTGAQNNSKSQIKTAAVTWRCSSLEVAEQKNRRLYYFITSFTWSSALFEVIIFIYYFSFWRCVFGAWGGGRSIPKPIIKTL